MVIVGSMMMGASIDLFVQADFGLDPLSLFQAGLGRSAPVSGDHIPGADDFHHYPSVLYRQETDRNRFYLKQRAGRSIYQVVFPR